MNIFRLEEGPVESAALMCDLHVNKMFVESMQLLASCFPLERLQEEDCPRTANGSTRKHFNPKHPSAKWVAESTYNLDWLIVHSIALERQRLKRGMNPHSSYKFLTWVIKNLDDATLVDANYRETPFRVAISQDSICREKVKDFDNLHYTTQYKLYYRYDKESFATWKKVNRPKFMYMDAEDIIKEYEV